MMKHNVLLLFLFLFIFHENGKFLIVFAEDDFIKTKGVNFILNGDLFYANGFNSYWLMYEASDTSQRNKVSTVFQEAVSHNLKVARTWAFSDGGNSPLQISPGSYNEKMFQGLDFVISEAKKNNIKLILSLVNNFDDFGGKKQYVAWARSQGQQISNDDEFYTNSIVKQYFKNHIKAILTRLNSITGVVYKDDPTIMAWELINEPRCTSDTSGKTIQAWITEMASYLKSIDNNHLLEIGLEGFYGPSDPQKQQHNPNNFQAGTDFIANNQIPGIDFATAHSYPDQWLSGQSDEAQLSFLKDWISNHIQDSQNILKKPILIAEFGKSTKDPGFNVNQRDQLFDAVYSSIFASASNGGAAAGGLFWQLLTEGIESMGDGYTIIFSQSPSTSNIISQESQKLERIHKMHSRLRNIGKWKKRAKESDRGNSRN